tara:strand:- start:1193 stop:1744 length:552 start_codon:yes stop_codon:yes gene_type:complete
MLNKDKLRKKYFLIRKKKYFNIKPSFFNPLIKILNTKYKKKIIYLSSYYPASFEVDTLKIFQAGMINRLKILLPVLKGNNMHFYSWEKNNVLKINRFGMLEPALLSNYIMPEVMLVPLLAYDKNNNRLGYGGGFYDRFLNKYLKVHNNILTIGIAFSFQKYHKLPVSKNDVKLHYILTEKGIF